MMNDHSPPSDASNATTEATGHKPSRKKLLIGFAVAVALIGLLWWGWATFVAGHRVSTENAYTAADVAQVTPMVAGAVKSIEVTDTERVWKDQVLLTLDDVDARLAFAAAEATLAETRRQVKQL
ncbi:biotin/lipoyl-binding protein, partial [Pseudomonas helleri]